MAKDEKRPGISERERIAVWAAAAGRCTFCNRIVHESDDLGLAVSIGEMAHIVGWSQKSPRGDSTLTTNQRQLAHNLVLACRNCHKPVDDNGVVGLYTIEELIKRKRKHEQRIRDLTAIGADRSAFVVRIVGMVRNIPPELSRETVLTATTAAGLYPKCLPSGHLNDVDLDLRNLGDPECKDHFKAALPAIDRLAAKIHDGVRVDSVQHVAVFGFARIPLLIALGARLDDKVRLQVFQRQRREDDNAWKWPDEPAPPPSFQTARAQLDDDPAGPVTLMVNLSGKIPRTDLPASLRNTGTLYELNPVEPARHGPNLIDSPAALASFESELRRFIARVEADHPGVGHIHLFCAVPVSAAIVTGRVLMPSISPAWRIFDRDLDGTFFEALEVKS